MWPHILLKVIQDEVIETFVGVFFSLDEYCLSFATSPGLKWFKFYVDIEQD